MALTFFGATAAGPSNVTSGSLFTLTTPAGAQANDIIQAVIVWNVAGAGGSWTAPGGWTLLSTRSSGNIAMELWERRIAAGHETDVYSFSNAYVSTLNNVCGGVLGYWGGQTNVTPDDQVTWDNATPVTLASMTNTGTVPDRVAPSAWYALGTAPGWTIDAGVTQRAGVSNAAVNFVLGDEVSSGAFPSRSSAVSGLTEGFADRWDYGDGQTSPAHLFDSRSVPEFQRRLLKATVQELPYMVTWDMVDEMLRRR